MALRQPVITWRKTNTASVPRSRPQNKTLQDAADVNLRLERTENNEGGGRRLSAAERVPRRDRQTAGLYRGRDASVGSSVSPQRWDQEKKKTGSMLEGSKLSAPFLE